MPHLFKRPRRPWNENRVVQGRRLHDNSAFYNSTDWRDHREYMKTVKKPVCAECALIGMVRNAKYLDHIDPLPPTGTGDPWDEDNQQWLCTHHHAVKSGREAHRGRGDKNPLP